MLVASLCSPHGINYQWLLTGKQSTCERLCRLFLRYRFILLPIFSPLSTHYPPMTMQFPSWVLLSSQLWNATIIWCSVMQFACFNVFQFDLTREGVASSHPSAVPRSTHINRPHLCSQLRNVLKTVRFIQCPVYFGSKFCFSSPFYLSSNDHPESRAISVSLFAVLNTFLCVFLTVNGSRTMSCLLSEWRCAWYSLLRKTLLVFRSFLAGHSSCRSRMSVVVQCCLSRECERRPVRYFPLFHIK